nr:hypothetical protein GCM10020241_05500 [Streptoalloteichus tenebrarius]
MYYHRDGTHLEFPDPLLQAVATRFVRMAKLGPVTLQQTQDQSRFPGFRARNVAQTNTALDAAVDAVLELPTRAPLPMDSPAVNRTPVYVEASPYTSWGRDHLVKACVDAGHTVVVPERFTASDPVAGALVDLTAARSSARLLADVSGPETPPGTALLIGAALASGVRIAAYQPRPTYTHAHGREPNWRNLMIQYACEAHPEDDEAVLSWLNA